MMEVNCSMPQVWPLRKLNILALPSYDDRVTYMPATGQIILSIKHWTTLTVRFNHVDIHTYLIDHRTCNSNDICSIDLPCWPSSWWYIHNNHCDCQTLPLWLSDPTTLTDRPYHSYCQNLLLWLTESCHSSNQILPLWLSELQNDCKVLHKLCH